MAITRLDRLRKELDIAISSEDFDLAFQVVNDMIDIDPENAQFWNSKGVVLSKMGRPEDALVSFDRSLEIDPEEAKTWYSKGCVLMDGGEYRIALACLYKTLDLDPEMQKARDRFNRCIDDWVASGTHRVGPEDELEEEEEILITGKEKVIKPREPAVAEDEEARTSAKEILKRKEVTGSFLDEDLFSEGEEEEGEAEAEEEQDKVEEEEWSEGELEGWDEEEEEEPESEEERDEAEEEEWSEGELEGWDEEEEEAETEEEEMVPVKTIKCRCGAEIPIYSNDRPYRFECPSCSRTGTLK